MKTEIETVNISKMKYVVQCFISDRTGRVVKISDFTMQQLSEAYQKACTYYGVVLPCPDNGNYKMYTIY